MITMRAHCSNLQSAAAHGNERFYHLIDSTVAFLLELHMLIKRRLFAMEIGETCKHLTSRHLSQMQI